jgi:hypothetical protein
MPVFYLKEFNCLTDMFGSIQFANGCNCWQSFHFSNFNFLPLILNLSYQRGFVKSKSKS